MLLGQQVSSHIIGFLFFWMLIKLMGLVFVQLVFGDASYMLSILDYQFEALIADNLKYSMEAKTISRELLSSCSR